MKMETQLVHCEVRLGSAANLETILTVCELRSLDGGVELKFETVFAGAKDAQARQAMAQFFVERSDLQKINRLLEQLKNL